ncbi:pantetheine-phosphate adenylyltransferase [Myxococcota bacterium]|nr:pantetheine-phosphate adenylyltransferase [Myxococcota bacterium]MBU1429731.1 pantetheine-phosphate adenylyltransferase [Myxococcota bacterium]MBU1897754.1 pantetheine-phosphate adenylyltransferase [Myxococcota bacterium]
MSTTTLYPGSFDPITCGHVDIVQRGLKVFDEVRIAVAINLKKQPLFSVAERVEMISALFVDEPRVRVVTFEGLLVDYARRQGISTVLRGLRAVSDFEFEFQLASMNRRLTDEVDFIFMMTGEDHYFVSSSLVREVAAHGGDISGLVPKSIQARLIERFKQS